MTFNYGEPISVELSDYLSDFTDGNDIADVSSMTGVSISTIDYVKRRKNSITERSEPAIVELMRLAIQNAENNIHRATQCKKDLTKILEAV